MERPEGVKGKSGLVSGLCCSGFARLGKAGQVSGSLKFDPVGWEPSPHPWANMPGIQPQSGISFLVLASVSTAGGLDS